MVTIIYGDQYVADFFKVGINIETKELNYHTGNLEHVSYSHP
jgi:hypothetical protein